jgi:hypothetical protein
VGEQTAGGREDNQDATNPRACTGLISSCPGGAPRYFQIETNSTRGLRGNSKFAVNLLEACNDSESFNHFRDRIAVLD